MSESVGELVRTHRSTASEPSSGISFFFSTLNCKMKRGRGTCMCEHRDYSGSNYWCMKPLSCNFKSLLSRQEKKRKLSIYLTAVKWRGWRWLSSEGETGEIPVWPKVVSAWNEIKFFFYKNLMCKVSPIRFLPPTCVRPIINIYHVGSWPWGSHRPYIKALENGGYGDDEINHTF